MTEKKIIQMADQAEKDYKAISKKYNKIGSKLSSKELKKAQDKLRKAIHLSGKFQWLKQQVQNGMSAKEAQAYIEQF